MCNELIGLHLREKSLYILWCVMIGTNTPLTSSRSPIPQIWNMPSYNNIHTHSRSKPKRRMFTLTFCGAHDLLGSATLCPLLFNHFNNWTSMFVFFLFLLAINLFFIFFFPFGHRFFFSLKSFKSLNSHHKAFIQAFIYAYNGNGIKYNLFIVFANMSKHWHFSHFPTKE